MPGKIKPGIFIVSYGVNIQMDARVRGFYLPVMGSNEAAQTTVVTIPNCRDITAVYQHRMPRAPLKARNNNTKFLRKQIEVSLYINKGVISGAEKKALSCYLLNAF
ncbi:MAG: hypothetical protein PHX14_13030 [Syntrophomonadaceae bacterium]|nr:hypothetical protein [Syntrophomonadaceae bacterium]